MRQEKKNETACHEQIGETGMANVVAYGGDVHDEQFEEIQACQKRSAITSHIPFPLATWFKEDRQGRNHLRSPEIHVHSLEDIDGVLKIVIRIFESVYLTKMVNKR